MIIKYSSEKRIPLSLRKKEISKELYKNSIESVFQYGQKNDAAQVSIIIVAYNEGDDLIRNLEHWKDQTMQCLEIILVDNGLDEETVEKVKKFNVLHIKSKENLGCCGGRNAGVVYANTEILIFGDADGYNLPDYVEKVLSVMQDEEIVAMRGKVLPIEIGRQEEFMPAHYDLGGEKIDSLIDTEGNSVWRTDDYVKAGGFEDSLAGGEGLALQYRMIEFYRYNKHQFLYTPDLILFHDYHQDDKKLTYKIRQNIIVDSQLKNKYPFMKDLIEYYLDIRHEKNVITTRTHSDDVNEIIKNIHEETDGEYKSLEEKNKKERYSNSSLIKEGAEKNFSVIIPCYDLGSLLPKAIDSVFAQILDDIEVIVVDDASPDEETQKVLDEVEKNVHVIRLKENGGVSVARNKGIEIAKSEYILCLDADDTIEPTYLEKAKNIFDADEKVGLVSCWAKFFGENESVWKSKDKLMIEDALVGSPVHTATCFRKSLHDTGGGYDASLRGYEDWDHWIRIIKQECIVRVIPEELFNYFVRLGSKVKTDNKKAEIFVASIVNNHRKLYEKYVDIVVAQKHYNWVMCDMRCTDLKNQARKNGISKVKLFVNEWLDTIVTAKKKIFPNKIF